MSIEFRNCYEEASIARSVHNTDVCEQVIRNTACGLFSVIESTPWHCRVTDAVTGEGMYIRATRTTREAADAECLRLWNAHSEFGDSSFSVLPKLPPVAAAPAPVIEACEADEIPF